MQTDLNRVFDPPEDSPVQRPSKNVLPVRKRVKDQTFAFDKVFDENITQGDVYEATTKGLLDSVLDGYNATVFAYGATGCGKTHTITYAYHIKARRDILTTNSGTSQHPGIIFLTMQELFERISEIQQDTVVEITLSYLEIYNETIRDLLAPAGPKQGLMLREDVNQAVSVAGLSSHHPQNVDQIMDMLIEGNAARTQSPTDANATSSRSHAVLQVNVSKRDRNASVSEPTTMATLSIIDLAGSERASATKNRGERLLEGANINKSLLALGSCINALCDPRKRNHVPYRNSKLTRLLKFSLGGNCKTVMIVCVSPSSAHFDETQNTLRYANRAKNIQTKVIRNVFNVDRHVKDFLRKIEEQKAMILHLQEEQKEHEAAAMVKFKKIEEKRIVLAKDGIARIRAAYQHSAQARSDKIACMKRLRHVERRIAMTTTWIAGFDAVCETREGEEAPASLTAMRRAASGVLAELESSVLHQRQQLVKSNWERALDSALQNGLRQLQEAGGSPGGGDSPESANLKREVELLKARADCEAQSAVLEQERNTGEVALMQILLQAHFETVAILGQIMQMDEQEAIKAARGVLGKLVASSSEATGQVIRPDGGLQITQAVPPTRSGTPKKRKPITLMGPSPMKNKIRPSLLNAAHVRQGLSPLGASPATSSPGRKKMGASRKSLSFARVSPRKRSPVKISKRGVRWRDDTDNGALADFQATPDRLDSTPEGMTPDIATMRVPDLPETVAEEQVKNEADDDDEDVSEAIDSPTLPALSSLDLGDRARVSNRFESGFLSKKPEHPRPQPLLSVTPVDDDENHESSHTVTARHMPLQEVTGNVGAAHDDETAHYSDDKEQARRISSAMKLKRNSSSGNTSAQIRLRDARRRSPSAQASTSTGSGGNGGSGSVTGSPDSSGLFSAGQARRMVRGSVDKNNDEWRTSNVLSPRSAPVVKQSVPGFRRSTLAVDAAVRETPVVRPGSGSVRASVAARPVTSSRTLWK